MLKGVPVAAEALPPTLTEHVTKLMPALRTGISTELLETWSRRVSGRDGRLFRQRLEAVLREPGANDDLAHDVEDCVTAALKRFREKVGSNELLEKWPQGASLSLVLGDPSITELYNSVSINEESLIPAPPFRLNEAKKEFIRKRRDLIQEASSAVRTQMAIANSLQSKYQGKGVERAPEYEAIVQIDWSRQRPGTLISLNGRLLAPSKYAMLFAVTRTEIRNILKKDEVQKQTASVAGDRGPGGVGEGNGGGVGPGLGGGEAEGGTAGSAGCPAPESKPWRVWPWWMWLVLIVAGIGFIVSGHYWGYRRGLRRTLHA